MIIRVLLDKYHSLQNLPFHKKKKVFVNNIKVGQYIIDGTVAFSGLKH